MGLFHQELTLLSHSRLPSENRRLHLHYTVVCVCNIRIFDLNSIPHYFCCLLSPSCWPFHYLSYTPTPMSPLLYVGYHPSPHLIHWPHPIPSYPYVSSQFNPAKAQAVPSLPHPSAQVAARCAPLCTKGCRGSGCYTSLLIVTYLTLQSHTFQIIPASACS